MTRCALAALVALLGCSSNSGGGPDATPVDPLPDALAGLFRASGTITGDGARAGDLNGLFIVGIGLSSLHSHGLGRSTDGATYSLPMPPSPPMEAQNGGTTATAYIVLTEIDDSIPLGPVDGSAQEKIIGLAPDHMIVYRAAPFVTQFPWESQFPSGWSCGRCERSPVDGVPDSLTPLEDCSDAVVNMGSFNTVDSCNLFSQ